MPAKSKAQFKFMQAVAHGGIKKPGLSEDKAEEFVAGQKGEAYSKLPYKVEESEESAKQPTPKKKMGKGKGKGKERVLPLAHKPKRAIDDLSIKSSLKR